MADCRIESKYVRNPFKMMDVCRDCGNSYNCNVFSLISGERNRCEGRGWRLLWKTMKEIFTDGL